MVDLPSEKYDFVNWDDDIPWKIIKFMFQSPPTRSVFFDIGVQVPSGLQSPRWFNRSGKVPNHRDDPPSVEVLQLIAAKLHPLNHTDRDYQDPIAFSLWCHKNNGLTIV